MKKNFLCLFVMLLCFLSSQYAGAQTYVAQNEKTGSQYESLTSAISEANIGETITMLADYSESLIIEKGITLDLNNHSIYQVYYRNNMTDGELILKNGTITLNVDGIDNYNTGYTGVVTLIDMNIPNVYVDGHTIYVNGGTYGRIGNQDSGGVSGTVYVCGDSFVGSFFYDNAIPYHGNTYLRGGVFTQNPTNYSHVLLDDGYKLVKLAEAPAGAPSGSYIHKVVEGDMARNMTTDVAYTSAQVAVDAAQPGETVKLFADFDGSLVVSNNITVDLNGNTVYYNLYLRNVDGEATVTNGVVNGTIDGKDGSSDAYNGTVNLRDLVVNRYDLYPDGHTINIYGGQYYGIKNHSAAGRYGVINIHDDAFIRAIDAKGGTTCLHGGIYKSDYSRTSYVSIATDHEVFLYSSAPSNAPDGSYVYGVGPQQYSRTTTNNRYGTICLNRPSNNITGATFYSIAGKRVNANNEPTSIVLEEVNDIVAGKPYIFLGSGENLHVTYSGLAVNEADSENGLVGSFTGQDVAEGMYLLSNNKIVKCGTDCNIGANRAYINMAEVQEYVEGQVSPSRMAVIGFDGVDGIDNLMIEGDNAVRYNTSGIRIPKGTKGIVIVNGKKVLNK